MISFYKETEFKDTEIGKIPKDWNVVKLGDVAKLESGGTPSRRKPEYWKNGTIPWVKSGELNDGVIYNSEEKITELGLKNSSAKVFPKGTLLIALYGATVGKTGILGIDASINQAVCAIIPKSSNSFNSKFLQYYLIFSRERLIAQSSGGAQPNIYLYVLRDFKIPLPPLEEQKKIAEILLTVDEAIQKTDEAIERTKRIKEGLMQRLLTKGIGHKEFKKVELNGSIVEIPKDWDVVKLRDVITEAKPGFACGKRDDNGIIQLRMDSIDPDGRINPNAYVKVPPPENVEEFLLKPGDILFNNTNSVDLIGKTAIFRGEFPKCVYSNHLTRIRVNPNKTIPEWVLYALIRLWKLGVFKAICRRHVHQAGINTKDLVNLKIPLPPLEEQKKIAEILSTVDKKMEILRKEKEKLENIKKGLMQKLLTGKVRVVV